MVTVVKYAEGSNFPLRLSTVLKLSVSPLTWTVSGSTTMRLTCTSMSSGTRSEISLSRSITRSSVLTPGIMKVDFFISLILAFISCTGACTLVTSGNVFL